MPTQSDASSGPRTTKTETTTVRQERADAEPARASDDHGKRDDDSHEDMFNLAHTD